MARKTVDIEYLVNIVNYALATDQRDNQQDYRLGLFTLLEDVLHNAEAYNGFSYLTVNDIPVGCRPGINVDPNDGQVLSDYDARFANTDYTRRKYA
jgi:hypothetical protein